MSLELYLAFVSATTVLMLIPGPNVALIVANSVSNGPKHGLVTVAGTSSAMVVQLVFTVVGLTGLLIILSAWFEWFRWVGVAYLIYLGIKAWCAPAVDLKTTTAPSKPLHEVFFQGFLVSLTNPKTLLFYAAFLPQFVSPAQGQTLQLLLLAATFLAIAVVVDSGWALLAHRARRALGLSGRVLNRLTGGLLLTAAAGLAVARRT